MIASHLKEEATNEIKIVYMQEYNTNRVGLHSFRDQKSNVGRNVLFNTDGIGAIHILTANL